MIKICSGLLAGILAPTAAHACACGCGVFDVATSYMLPNGPGGMLFEQYDYEDQTQNWKGTSKAPSANNDDKEIESHFSTLGFEYMFNRSWGVEAELPYNFRRFRGTMDDGEIATHRWSGLGDIHIEGIFTGFSSDLSSGLTLGLKLPTGEIHEDTALVDRDTQIGAGSTDVLFGGFHRSKFTKSEQWEWFAQFQLDLPTLIQEGYRPGIEFGASGGVDYTGLSLGKARIIPLAQVLLSERTSDSGRNSDSQNTGYQRIMLAPALEVDLHPISIYADVELPVFQNFTGNQLAASILFKFAVSYMF